MNAAEREQKLRDDNRILRDALIASPSRQRVSDPSYWSWFRGARQRALDATKPLVEDLAHV